MSIVSQTPGIGYGDFPPLHHPVRRFTVAEYHDMLRTGILKSGDPCELIEGVVVTKMTKYPPHRIATGEVRKALENVIPSGWYVDSQEPITTGDSEPEPDVAVIRGRTRDYADRHPGPSDIALVVEVADESLARDRGPKKRLYARAMISVYWIVNLLDRQIEVYTDPTGPADEPDFRQQRVFREGESVPLEMEGKELAVLAVQNVMP